MDTSPQPALDQAADLGRRAVDMRSDTRSTLAHLSAVCPFLEAGRSGARLRPLCCSPLAALAAFSRVGGWMPTLPRGERADGSDRALPTLGQAPSPDCAPQGPLLNGWEV